jgi:hypothetical protein
LVGAPVKGLAVKAKLLTLKKLLDEVVPIFSALP